ncbi:DUF4435 domain-containing protein [Shewanella chilikensis]|uniref:DUF4435 domain-containing protein n=1 Tax=Shewanella chilikensis TaxID=558541 RepID=UPI00399A4CD1
MLPERRSSAKFAKSAFFEDYNDIDIYIEDTAEGYAKLFKHLFKRVFEGEYNIDNVFPIGSRSNVISKCEELQEKVERPSLFIVDGDLYQLKGEPKPIPKGTFVLPRYCIENILIDSEAIVEFVDEENIDKDKDTLQALLDFEGWRDFNSEHLVPLFAEYAIAQKLSTPIKTIKYSLSNLYETNTGFVSPELVLKRIKEVRAASIKHVGEPKYNSTRIGVIDLMKTNECRMLKYVSGKDYLMPLLMVKIRGLISSQPSKINFRQRVAMKCDISMLYPAKEHVLMAS